MTDYLARGLQIISAVVDPGVYVLGGGASASADVYLDKLREKYAACALSVSTKTPIEVAELATMRVSSVLRTWRCAPLRARCRRASCTRRMAVRCPARRRVRIAVDEEAGSKWSRPLVLHAVFVLELPHWEVRGGLSSCQRVALPGAALALRTASSARMVLVTRSAAII